MQTHQNFGIDPEELGDVLVMLEKSFDFKLKNNELAHVKTYGELCEAVLNKIGNTHVEDCTTQQSFYKLKDAILNVTDNEEDSIRPSTPLKLIFPKANRRKQINALQNKLGFKFKILGAGSVASVLFLIAIVASIVFLFIKVSYGLYGIAASIIAFLITDKFSKSFTPDVTTVKSLARKLTAEHYTKVRRNRGTFNRAEVEQQIEYLFTEYLLVEKEELKREAIVI
jgi:hypothetical protein